MDFYEQCFSKNLDKQFDVELNKINELTWLPWVGKDYFQSRILIVAESHYTNNNDKNVAELEKQRIMAQPHFTREIIAEHPVAGKEEAGWSSPTFDNLHRLLVSDSLNSDIPRRAVLWQNLGYMNIIQRPMWYSPGHKERPAGDDFETGWRVVTEILRILDPKLCIFAGLQAANSFNFAMNRLGLQYEPIKYGDAIGRCRPRIASCQIARNSTPIIFIRHPSQYFSWNSWQRFVFDDNRMHFQKCLLERVYK